jgi:hypothetical protein
MLYTNIFSPSDLVITNTFVNAFNQKQLKNIPVLVIAFTQTTSVNNGGSVTITCPGASAIYFSTSLINAPGDGVYAGETITGLSRRNEDLEQYEKPLTPPAGVRLSAYGVDNDGNMGSIYVWEVF